VLSPRAEPGKQPQEASDDERAIRILMIFWPHVTDTEYMILSTRDRSILGLTMGAVRVLNIEPMEIHQRAVFFAEWCVGRARACVKRERGCAHAVLAIRAARCRVPNFNEDQAQDTLRSPAGLVCTIGDYMLEVRQCARQRLFHRAARADDRRPELQ
jgi:hypothetical protein